MCGSAGSGKTTIARKFEANGFIRLSFDDESFKRGINVHPLPPQLHREIKEFLDIELIHNIKLENDVVLDYSFWSKTMRKEYIDLLATYNIEPIIFYVHVSKETIVDRIQMRSGNHQDSILLPLQIALEYYDNFQVPSENEGIIIVVNGEKIEENL